MKGNSDEELIAIYTDHAAGEGRRDAAVNELFERYQTRVALWCYRIAGDTDRARDLAQEVFLRALRSLGGFRGDAKFSTWIYTIARNHCFNAAKAASGRAEDTMEGFDLPDTSRRGVDDEVELASEVGQMQQLLQRTLDETERQVMTLHYGEDLSLGEVTRLLGLTNASGAKACIVSARRKLTKAIERLKAAGGRKEER